MNTRSSVLIVDDNEDSRLAIKAALRKKKYIFYEAKNGAEGVEIAQRYLPDVIIMDLMMPIMNGYEALECIKKSSVTQDIPVIIITAIGSMDEKIVALEKGADGLWSKPFDRHMIVKQIDAILNIRKNQRLHNDSQAEHIQSSIDVILHQQSQELIHYYYTDSLTSLPNRSQLIKDISKQTNCGLILFDIDSFKDIVYFYGHNVGDSCLKGFVPRLKKILLDENIYSFYRISSDIFAVLIKDIEGISTIQKAMEEVKQDFFYTPYLMCHSHDIPIRITMGGSVFEEELLISAEKALKTAKITGLESMIYDENSDVFKSYENNMVWINKITEAIADDRIVPFFQPIINNATGDIEKYESLVRLIEKDGKVISPFYFLEIAKKSRLYASITKRVVQKSFEKFAKTSYAFSINLSALDMINPEISSYIFEQLSHFPQCERVIFELLESDGVENYTEVFRFIEKVKSFGCSVAIDDFGSGYSNFIHLVQLDVDIIKIDGSLIRDLDTNQNAQLVVETIISFAKKLGVPTVAEFVHNKAIQTIVKELGIDFSQGYYFGEPKDRLVLEL